MGHVTTPVHSRELATTTVGRRLVFAGSLRLGVLGAVAALSMAVLVSAAPAASAATTQTATCVDGGGVRWNSQAVWGAVYPAANGSAAVSMDYAGWTTTRSGTVRTDSTVKTFDGAGTLLQTLSWTGAYDYGGGKAFKVRNPANPPSAPGQTSVVVTLGVDGDGFGNCAVTFTQPGSPSPASVSDRYEADVITATNGERTSRGLVALNAQACVDTYAELQSAKMATQMRLFHSDLQPILSGCGLRAVGENVAFGYPDGTAATAGWMGSPGHRGNLLNPRYRLIGVGASRDSTGRWYAAQVFGSTS